MRRIFLDLYDIKGHYEMHSDGACDDYRIGGCLSRQFVIEYAIIMAMKHHCILGHGSCFEGRRIHLLPRLRIPQKPATASKRVLSMFDDHLIQVAVCRLDHRSNCQKIRSTKC